MVLENAEVVKESELLKSEVKREGKEYVLSDGGRSSYTEITKAAVQKSGDAEDLLLKK